jgi:hypothetical protein
MEKVNKSKNIMVKQGQAYKLKNSNQFYEVIRLGNIERNEPIEYDGVYVCEILPDGKIEKKSESWYSVDLFLSQFVLVRDAL